MDQLVERANVVGVLARHECSSTGAAIVSRWGSVLLRLAHQWPGHRGWRNDD